MISTCVLIENFFLLGVSIIRGSTVAMTCLYLCHSIDDRRNLILLKNKEHGISMKNVLCWCHRLEVLPVDVVARPGGWGVDGCDVGVVNLRYHDSIRQVEVVVL